VLSRINKEVGVAGTRGHDLAILNDLDGLPFVPVYHADVVIVSQHLLDAGRDPFSAIRSRDTHGSECLSNLTGAGAAGVHFENHLDDRRPFRIRFQRVAFPLAFLYHDFVVAIGRFLTDEIAVLHGEQPPVSHDSFLIFQKFVATLQFPLKHIPVPFVPEVVGILQRDDDSIGIPEQLHQTANVFQVATAEALRLDNQHGLDPRRFHPPQYLLYAGAALNGFARHDFPVTVCFRNLPAVIRYVANHPVIQHLLML